MATFGENYSDYPVGQQQDVLYDVIGFGNAPEDQYAHDLFYNYYYNDNISVSNRIQLYDQLVDYLSSYYGIDFNETWDWEDFRNWYDGAA